jgi:hypothetical protein
VTCYNQVKSSGRKRKEKNIPEILFLFLFARESEFFYSWKRVKLQLDLAWYDNSTTTLWKNQDVTWTGPVECLVLLTTV